MNFYKIVGRLAIGGRLTIPKVGDPVEMVKMYFVTYIYEDDNLRRISHNYHSKAVKSILETWS